MTSGSNERTTARLLLRIDAGHIVGYGHAVRCSALVEAIGGATEVVIAGDESRELSHYFPGARFRSVTSEDFESILIGERPSAVIVDLPRHDADLWRLLRAHAPLIIAIDDEGGGIEADIVVNGAVPESCHRYPALRSGAIALTGPEYTLLRPAFAQARWRDPRAPSVVVVVGSGERAQDWAFAVFLLHGESGKYRPAFEKLLNDTANGIAYLPEERPHSVLPEAWDPHSVRPLLERYMGVDLTQLDKEYQAYIRQIAFSVDLPVDPP